MPVINMYPLKSVIIHPRTQEQQYEGETDLKAFEYFAMNIKHTIIYNGDIFTVRDFTRLKTLFPYIKHWMIGRGILKNPFLCADIRGIPYNKQEMLPLYLRSLQENFAESLYHYNEITILNKMKEFTKYLSLNYDFDATPLLREPSLEEFNKKFYNVFTSKLK